MIFPDRQHNHSNRLTLTALLLILAACLPVRAASRPKITADSAILVDAASGRILYEKNAHKKRPIASTTKIMTAMVAMDNCELEETTTVSRYAAAVDGSRLGLEAGEEIKVEALVKALLIKSANDAALALAEHVGRTSRPAEERDKYSSDVNVGLFVDMMNNRAFESGARETHFVNPHGLHDSKHYSSAYDLALLSRQAMKQPLFRQFVNMRSCSLKRPNGSEITFTNRNRLLFKDENVDGIKTGYVRQSGRCLVASASRDGWRLIAVLLDSADLWKDAEALLDYGFDNWEATVFATVQEPLLEARVIGGKSQEIPVVAAKDLVEIRPPGKESDIAEKVELKRLFAPIRQGEEVGRLWLFREGHQVGSTRLLAAANMEQALWLVSIGIVGRIFLTIAVAVAGLKVYGKTAKIARRCRRRLSA